MWLEQIGRVLLVCSLFNMAILVVWFGMFVFARDLIYRLHSRWFKLTPEQFDMTHYMGMAIYKVAILCLNIVPYAAILSLR